MMRMPDQDEANSHNLSSSSQFSSNEALIQWWKMIHHYFEHEWEENFQEIDNVQDLNDESLIQWC